MSDTPRTTTNPAMDQRIAPSRLTKYSTLVVFFLCMLLHSITLPTQGLTDDDDFYAPAAISYAKWWGEAVSPSSMGQAWQQKSIDQAFKPNHEHPPVAKYAMGFAYSVLYRWFGVVPSLDAVSWGVATLASILVAAVYFAMSLFVNPWAAVCAATWLILLPRFWMHSEVATLDVPVASLVFLTGLIGFLAVDKDRLAPDVLASWRRGWHKMAWACGIFAGLALGTKLNAPFALLPVGIYAILSLLQPMRQMKKS